VAFASELIALGVLEDEVGDQATLARAIAYAADPGREGYAALPGADVISCSLGPYNQSWPMTEDLRLAIDFAVTNGRGGLGTPVFWATDNAAIAIAVDQVCSYANSIAVGSSDWRDEPGGSAYGPELDFVATGNGVWSTRRSDQYGPGWGTSYAAPVAAGVGALLISHNAGLTWDAVRQAMRDGCTPIGTGVVYNSAGHSNECGFGRVDAAQALTLI
jgi:thermitase